MKTTQVKRVLWRVVEFAALVAVSAMAYKYARAAGVQFRGNELYGGEVCVPPFILGGWYGMKVFIRDIKEWMKNEDV